MSGITNRLLGWGRCQAFSLCFVLLSVSCLAQSKGLVMATTFSPGTTAWIIQHWQTEPESVTIRTLNRTSSSSEQLLDTTNAENVGLILTSSPMLLQYLQKH